MKPTYLLLSFLLCFGFGTAQNMVHIYVNKTATDLEVMLVSTTDFQGIVSNLQFTIASDDPSVNLGAVQQNTDESVYIPMAKAGTETVANGVFYQKFAGFGMVNMSVPNVQWMALQPVLLMKIVPSNLNATYLIVNDTWTFAENGDFFVELNGANKTGLISTADAFPLQLGPLTANWLGKDIRLSWQTYQEEALAHFEVERGEKADQLVKIGQQAAVGNSAQTLDYHFTDTEVQPFTEKWFYRIKAVSLNGESQYSNIVVLRTDKAADVMVYPNPFRHQFVVNVSQPALRQIQIRVLDLYGREIYTSQSLATTLQTQIESETWASGIYVLEVNAGGQSQSHKIIKE